jgi:hypothetical protein
VSEVSNPTAAASQKVTIHLCTYYEANKKLSTFKRVLIGTGIVTGVVCAIGTGIAAAGALGILAAGNLLTAASVMALVGGSISGPTLGVAAYLPSGESIADYDRGKPKGSREVAESDEWQDLGVTYEQALGEPYPCVEKA